MYFLWGRKGRSGLAHALLKFLNSKYRKDQLKIIPMTLGPNKADSKWNLSSLFSIDTSSINTVKLMDRSYF